MIRWDSRIDLYRSRSPYSTIPRLAVGEFRIVSCCAETFRYRDGVPRSLGPIPSRPALSKLQKSFAVPVQRTSSIPFIV